MTTKSGERASVTIVVAGIMVVALIAGWTVLRLGGLVAARARAESAADAAALAAADTLALGRSSRAATAAARETAAANGVSLVRCRCATPIVEVEVSQRVRPFVGFVEDLRARARAEIRPNFPTSRGTWG